MTLSTMPVDIMHNWQNELAKAQGYRSFEMLAMAAITDTWAARLFDSIQKEVRNRTRYFAA